MKKINYYLILFIVFALPSYLIRFNILGIPTTLLEILIYLSAIISLFSLRNTHIIFPKKLIIPIVLFVIGGIIGVIVAPEKMVALGQFRAYIFDPILFFGALSINIKSEKEIKNILYILFLSSIYVSAYSIWQYIAGNVSDDGRIIGIFGYSPNYTAFYLVPLFIIGLYLTYFDRKSSLALTILKTSLLIITLSAIILTGSRGAIFAIIGSIALSLAIRYVYFLKNKLHKTIIIFSLIVVTLCAGYLLIKPDMSVSGTDAGRIGSSNNIRWEIYKTTIMQILPSDYNFLWGLGLGNYQVYFTNISRGWVNYPEYIAPKALTAHNIFLHTWLSIGILGLIGFIWLLVIFFKKLIFKNPISFMLFVVMLAILIQGLVDTPYWKNDLSVMFWLILFAMVLNYDNSKKNQNK